MISSVTASERPKGGYGLTAATVIRPQGPSLIAAVTKTFGHKRIAAERDHFGRKRGLAVNQKRLFRPKGPILAEKGLTVKCRKADGVAAATERLLRP